MPDKPLAIATYAAGASLAAITLIYVFGPTWYGPGDAWKSRRRDVVGLRNPANDCFINSVLQTLAGNPGLRNYLAHEIARRTLDGGGEIYETLADIPEDDQSVQPNTTRLAPWMRLDLQRATITRALKQVLDSLNEQSVGSRSKVISAAAFISSLERAFNTALNRTQQDAQEFLQLVTERLSDEFHAGEKVRLAAARSSSGDRHEPQSLRNDNSSHALSEAYNPNGFPMEGKLEASITCESCDFVPRPAVSKFTMLTLHVPQRTSTTTLSACFDGLFMIEHIDDYCCDRCRLQHALVMKRSQRTASSSPRLEREIQDIEHAIATDPEKPPPSVELPELQSSPKRRIARSSRISAYPEVLAIHLSRSVWNPQSYSVKNQAKVAFEEELVLGGLLEQRFRYRLLGVVAHHGAHNSGHYESFRRQQRDEAEEAAESGQSLLDGGTDTSETVAAAATAMATGNDGSMAKLRQNLTSRITKRAAKRQQDRWWRISDDRARECTIRDVLGMQREVYLLLYARVLGG